MTMTVPANTLRTQIDTDSDSDNDSPRWAPCKAKQIPRKRINHLGIASECAKFAYIVRFKAKRRKITPTKGLPVMHICHTHTPHSQLPCGVYRANNKNTKILGENFGLLLAKKFSQNFFALRFGTQT